VSNLFIIKTNYNQMKFQKNNFEDFVNDSSELLFKTIRTLSTKNKHLNIALSGGKTPLPIYRRLSDYNLNWKNISFFLVDERCVANTHQESNFFNIKTHFFDFINSSYHKIVQENISFEKSANNYQKLITKKLTTVNNIPQFDLVVLGMGLDGHIASLFPDTKALNEKKALIVLNYIPQLNTQRITMTYPLLMNSKKIVMIIKGKGKKKVLINSLIKKLPVSVLIPKLNLILN